ncbi:MAG: Hsp70 family protein [Sandaracinaceae bacterium]
MRLGIDFGTTRTVVAAAADGRYPVASFDHPDSFRTWLPTMAAWNGGRWCYAEEAEPLVRSGRVRGIRSIKRMLGMLGLDDVVPELDGPPVTARELVAGYLGALKERLRHHANLGLRADEPLEAMVAVPANASSRQRFLTLEAFRDAGFDVLGMVNEPSAAAIEYAHRNARAISPRSPKRYVVVYDLGGGTFDTAAVSLQHQTFELLASEGIQRLGGDDFDEAILALWRDAVGHGPLPPETRTACLEVCRSAKEALSPQSRRLFLDAGPDLPLAPVTLDLVAVHGRCAPLIDRTLDRLEDVFRALPPDLDRDDPRQLGGVYLVGGAAAFPPVLRALRARHRRKVLLAPEPHAATAIGLAVAADPTASVKVREATTRYFGVWREAQDGHDSVFDPILRKDRAPAGSAPVVVERGYRPIHTVGHLRFIECTRLDAQGQPAGDVSPFGELYFPYDPSLATRSDLAGLQVERRPELGGQEIVERYVYAKDGTIAVHIANRTGGYARELVFAT